jgi:hypothetical protein
MEKGHFVNIVYQLHFKTSSKQCHSQTHVYILHVTKLFHIAILLFTHTNSDPNPNDSSMDFGFTRAISYIFEGKKSTTFPAQFREKPLLHRQTMALPYLHTNHGAATETSGCRK